MSMVHHWRSVNDHEGYTKTQLEILSVTIAESLKSEDRLSLFPTKRDTTSFAMAVLKTDYRESTKDNMPKHWFDKLPHSHVALDDAVEQGALFCNMLKESRS